jgi:tRNA(Ile2) C34 agmatinyltransferase TiaS
MNGVAQRVLVGIDDTDNIDSRGTGFRAREFGRELAEAGLAKVRGISRHQLFVHPDIPYTSHNSALCLDMDWHGGPIDRLGDLVRDYLSRTAAPGSDAGFCIASFEKVGAEAVDFGQRAKTEVLTKEEAVALAAHRGFCLEGVTGDHGGIIGAFACVGLRRTGNDGRFVWVEGVRELNGIATARHLLEQTGIDVLRNVSGPKEPAADDLIDVAPWPRPVLLDHKAVLLIEEREVLHDTVGWSIVPREGTKHY